LQGPKAFDVLALSGGDGPSLAQLPSFHFRDATIANVPCTVARTGYTGEDGVEIFCPTDGAAQIFRTLLSLGTPLGLEPAGLAARDTLRLEARLSLYGNEIDETTNPLEAGLGWVVKMAKGDFIGRAALERIKAAGLSRKLIGFEMAGRGIARHGYPLLTKDGIKVGVCTSGSPGPTVNKNIGLGYLPAPMTEIGTEFTVDCRGRSIEAVVVKTPFYKRS
jgi:aminomethyltransferase